MRDSVKKTINERYEKIMREMIGGCLWGEPIDENNIKMVVVAAYVMGEIEILHPSRIDKSAYESAEYDT